MEQLVRVRRTFDDGTAEVIHLRESACSGDCHKCGGCTAAQETILLVVQNPIGAKPGELVKLESETAPVLTAAAMVYGLPLVLFFAGYALGSMWNLGAVMGLAGFAAGVACSVVYDRKVARKKKPVYTISGYASISDIPQKRR